MVRSLLAWLLVLAGVVVSLLEGVPVELPSVALGSPVLLHAERVVALLAVVLGLLALVARAGRGELPLQVGTSGLGYEAQSTEEAVAAGVELNARLDRLELRLRALEDG